MNSSLISNLLPTNQKWILFLFILSGINLNVVKTQDISPNLILPIAHIHSVSSIDLSFDNQLALTASVDNTALIWDVNTGTLLKILDGHTGWVNSARFCRDAQKVITASSDNTARIWDVNSGYLLHLLEGHKRTVFSAQFSPDGQKVVTASLDGTARIWCVQSGSLLHILEGHKDEVRHAQYSPDGQIVVTASFDGCVKMWDVKTGSLLHLLDKHDAEVLSAQFSPDGKYLVTASMDHTAISWEVSSGQPLHILKGHTSYVRTAEFSPQGNLILTSSYDSTAILWNAGSGTKESLLKGHNGSLESAAFSADGEKIVTASADKSARIWSTESGELLHVLNTNAAPQSTINGHLSHSISAKFCNAGRKILTAGGTNIQLWDVRSGKQLINIEGHTAYVRKVEFNRDNQFILAQSWHSPARLWDIEKGSIESILSKDGENCRSAQFSTDGKLVVISSSDSTAHVYNVQAGTFLHSFTGHRGNVNFSEFCPNSKQIVTASSDSTAIIWDVETATPLIKLKGHTGRVYDARFSPDRKRVLTTSSDTTVRIWNARAGELLNTFKDVEIDYISSSHFCPNGDMVIIADGLRIRILDSYTGAMLHTLPGHQNSGNTNPFSPDGNLVVTASWNRTAQVWDLKTGEQLYLLEGHSQGVNSAQFSPNGDKIVTTSYGEIRLWNTHTGKLLKEFEVKGHLRTLNYENRQFITHDNSLLHLYDLNTGKLLYSFVAIGQDDWLVIDEHHRFDGSPGARDMLYFVCGLEVTTLNQLRDALYVPGLATKILNGEDINFPKLEELEICGVFPDIQLKEETEDYFKYLIKPGKKEVETLEIWLNNRLFRSLPFSEAIKTEEGYVLSISRPEIEAFFVKGEDNTISVNGLIRLMDTEARSRGMAVVNREYREKQADPRLFSLMIGVNDYRDDRLNLRFPAKDAMDLGEVIELAAGKLLGEDNVFTYYVHSKVNQTGGFTTPEKEGIRRALEEIGQQSRPEDVLLIFFAGHGTVRDSDGQFVLLTADASKLLPTGITTAELQEWISPDGPHQMKANKAILIFDACNSGRGAEEMIAWARSDEETRRRRQIDDLSDKAGMYILAASAASQNAYEVRHYEQGLLSYSLLHTLQNNPGILDDNSFLNVQKWFLDSESYLQNMVRELGLQQQAQPYGTANIRIGIVDDEVRSVIQLAEIRPVVYCAVAINSTLALDNLQIKDRLNNALQEISDRGSSASVIYSYQGSTQAYRINVSYELEGEAIKCRISLLRANELVHQMEISGSIDHMEELIEQILEGVLEVVN